MYTVTKRLGNRVKNVDIFLLPCYGVRAETYYMKAKNGCGKVNGFLLEIRFQKKGKVYLLIPRSSILAKEDKNMIKGHMDLQTPARYLLSSLERNP